ncbi:hypothetical protein [Aphis citricidus bunyavirus]|uniref:Nucleoprotein n=1 Tax=Aphis citricidus bunyavirus TaxID=2599343 RepID=A0A5B8GNZ7_9VIRU|nr:hypothetical protein QK833_sSgp1 [Aphis citricidus bunyavirus]QDW80895.1 hypothetical protein [Aphis citricidus bunyavirus]
MSKSIGTLIEEYSKSTADAIDRVVQARDELIRFDFEHADTDKLAELTHFADIAAYQGFDPQMIAFVLLSKRAERLTDRELDIERMIIMSIERGNNITSIKKNSNPDFISIVNRLVSTYDIKAKAGSSRANITFSRVAMSFPDVTCSYLSIAKSTTVPRTLISSISLDYPSYMMTSSFGSIIPNKGGMSEVLKEAFYVHQYEFTKIVSNKNKASHSSMVSDVIKYTDAAMKGSVLKDDDKLKLLLTWKILSLKNGKYSPSSAVLNAATVWKENYLDRKDN